MFNSALFRKCLDGLGLDDEDVDMIWFWKKLRFVC